MTHRRLTYNGNLFRVEEQEVPGRAKPYEFVSRIGATTVLPIIRGENGDSQALVIKNQRYHYGTSLGLPAGNRAGGFDTPEHPATTGLRELGEETGYGYPAGQEPDVSLFRLRTYSSTIAYPVHFAVVRNPTYIGGEVNSAHEQITLQPMPLEEYLNPLFDLDRGETYPEVNAAFARAGMQIGREAVMQWLVSPNAAATELVNESFAPWLIAESAA